jgi:hypothetical protein
VPTIVVTTERFEGLSREAAAQSGLPDARIVSVEHPIGGVKREVLDERADRIVDDVMRAWTRHGAAT